MPTRNIRCPTTWCGEDCFWGIPSAPIGVRRTQGAVMRTDVNSGEYSPHIDGLRAIAVIAVIVYHLDASWLPAGFVGVDVFFVISGFVVSASLARSPDVGVWPSMMRFYARRLRRIMPALVTTLLTTAVLSTLLIP